MDRAATIVEIQKLIEEQMEITIDGPDAPIDIDSFTMMLVVTFSSDELGVDLDMESLDFDEVKTLNSLADLILTNTV